MSPRECAKKQSHRPDLADQRSGQAKRDVHLGKSASHCCKASRLGVVYSNESVKEADDNRHRRHPGKSHSPQETLSLLVVFHLLRSFPPLPRRHPLRLPLALLLRRRARQELRPPPFPHRLLPAPGWSRAPPPHCAPASPASPPRTPPTAFPSPDSPRSPPSSPPSPPPHSQSSQNSPAPPANTPRPAPDSKSQWHAALRPPPQIPPYSSRTPKPGTNSKHLSPCVPAEPPTTAADFPSHTSHDAAPWDRIS